jgi:hypothetical protein
VTLASGESGVSSLTVDGESVYWAAVDGAIKKVPLAGGPPTTLVVSQDTPGGTSVNVAVDSTSVYWTDSSAGTVMKLTPK